MRGKMFGMRKRLEQKRDEEVKDAELQAKKGDAGA
jgi:hypothetical protein